MSAPGNSTNTQPAGEGQSQPETEPVIEDATGQSQGSEPFADSGDEEGLSADASQGTEDGGPELSGNGEAQDQGGAGGEGDAPDDEAAGEPPAGVPVEIFDSEQDAEAEHPEDDDDDSGPDEEVDDESEPPADDARDDDSGVITFDGDSGLVIEASGPESDDEIVFIEGDSEYIDVVTIGNRPEESGADSDDAGPEIFPVDIRIANPSIGRPLPIESIGNIRIPLELDNDDDSVPAPDEIERPSMDEQPDPALFGGLPGPAPRPGFDPSQGPAGTPNVREILTESRPGIVFPDQTKDAGSAAPATEDPLDVFEPRPAPQRPFPFATEPSKQVQGSNESGDDGMPPLSFTVPDQREFGQDNLEPTGSTEADTPDVAPAGPSREFSPGPRQAFDINDVLGSPFTFGTGVRRVSDFEDDDDSEPDDDDLEI